MSEEEAMVVVVAAAVMMMVVIEGRRSRGYLKREQFMAERDKGKE